MGANGGEWEFSPGSPRGRMGANGGEWEKFFGVPFWGQDGRGEPRRTAANGGEWGRMKFFILGNFF